MFLNLRYVLLLVFVFSVWSYRVPPPMPSKRALYLAQVLGGICWWWILYHIATEPEHIYVSFYSLL